MFDRILGVIDEVREMVAGWVSETWGRVASVVEEVHGLLEARREAARAELERQLEEIEATRAELERLRKERAELEREVQELQEKRAELEQEVEELQGEKEALEQEVESEQEELARILDEIAETKQMLDDLREERELSEEEIEEEEKRRMMEEWETDEAGVELLFYTLSPYVPGGGGWRLRGTFTPPEAIAYVQDLPEWMPEAGYIVIVVRSPGVAEVWVKETSKSRRGRK